MVDLTIVTCIAPCLLGQRDAEGAAGLLQTFLDAGVPLVVYVEEGWKEAIESRRGEGPVRFHETSPSRRWSAFAFRAELEAACAA